MPLRRRRVWVTCLWAGSSLIFSAVPTLSQQADNRQPASPPDNGQSTPAPGNDQPSTGGGTTLELPEVEVTASRNDLLGTATTASQESLAIRKSSSPRFTVQARF